MSQDNQEVYWEGPITKELTLNKGDRIQVWSNNLKERGNQPDYKLKVLRAGEIKGQSVSEKITGLWRRFFTRRPKQ